MDEIKVAAARSRGDRSLSMLDGSSLSSVPTVTQLADRDFATNYRDAMRPVLVHGARETWSACQRGSPQYFDQVAGSLTVPVKTLKNGDTKISTWRLADYVRFIMEQPRVGDGVLPDAGKSHCHDIPLLGLVESLAGDCQPFPANFLSPWYRRH